MVRGRNMTHDMSVSGKILDFRWTMVGMHYVMLICFNNCAYVAWRIHIDGLMSKSHTVFSSKENSRVASRHHLVCLNLKVV